MILKSALSIAPRAMFLIACVGALLVLLLVDPGAGPNIGGGVLLLLLMPVTVVMTLVDGVLLLIAVLVRRRRIGRGVRAENADLGGVPMAARTANLAISAASACVVFWPVGAM